MYIRIDLMNREEHTWPNPFTKWDAGQMIESLRGTNREPPKTTT